LIAIHLPGLILKGEAIKMQREEEAAIQLNKRLPDLKKLSKHNHHFFN